MAKIKLSAIGITNLSGKAGGTIFSRNRGGNYAKNFVVPTNPNTGFQQGVRSIFGSMSAIWRNMTESGRNSFRQQAPNYPVKDVFGDSKTLSGFQLMMKLNTNRSNVGLVPLAGLGAPLGVNPVVSVDAAFAVVNTAGVLTGIDFGFDLQESSAGSYDSAYIVEMTPPLLPGRKYQNSDFRVLDYTDPISGVGTVSVTDLQGTAFSEYLARFGQPNIGDRIAMRIKPINASNGEDGAWWYEEATVSGT